MDDENITEPKNGNEIVFSERPDEKLDNFAKCNDDTVKESVIESERFKVENLKRIANGEKPIELPAVTNTLPETATDEPVTNEWKPPSQVLTKRLLKNVDRTGRVLENITKIPGIAFTQEESDAITEDLINILELDDTKLKEMSKAVSALDLGLIVLDKGMLYKNGKEKMQRGLP